MAIFRRIVTTCWQVLKWTFLVAVVALAIGVAYFYRQVDQQLRNEVLKRLAAQYPHLKISFRSVELVQQTQQEGILLRGLRLEQPEAEGWLPLVECEEVFFGGPTDWQHLLQGDVPIHRILIRRPTVYLRRSAEGEWNYGHLKPQAALPGQKPELVVEDGTVVLAAEGAKTASPILLRDVQAVISPVESADAGTSASQVPSDPPRTAQQVRLTLSGQGLQELSVEGWLDADSGDYVLQGKAVGWEIRPDWQAVVPIQQAPAWLPAESFQGQMDMSFRIAHRPSRQEPLQWQLAGRLTNGRLQDPRLAYPLTDIWAVFRADADTFQVDQLFARHGPTTLRVSYRRNGYQANCPFHLEAEIRHLELRREWLALAPMAPSLLRQWELYRPSGQVHLDVVLDYDGQHWFPQATVECLDVSFLYAKFPYRLDHGQGRLELRNDRLWLQLTAFSENQPVRINAEIGHPLREPTGWVEIQAQELPIDQKFFDALQEPTRRFLAPLHPQGCLDVAYRWYRDRPDDAGHRQIRLNLRRGAVCYDRFPYPIRNLGGRLEFSDGRWEFWGLSGSNGSAQIRGYGHLIPLEDPASPQPPHTAGVEGETGLAPGMLNPVELRQAGASPESLSSGSALLPRIFEPVQEQLPPMELYLNLVADKVPLDEELRDALPPAAQRLWNQLRPTGQVNLKELEIRYRTGQPTAEVRFTAQPIPDRSSIEPVAFPYRLEKLQGTLFFAQNQVFWQDFRGEHGPVRVAADLFGRFQPDGAWQLEMENLFVDRLPLDRELTKALPEPLKKAFAALNPEGTLGLRGRWQLAQSAEPAATLTSRWDLRLTTIGGRMQPGILLENLHGGVELAGVWTGQDYALWGQLDLDSLLYQGCQLTEVRGPFWIDPQQVLFGPDALSRRQEYLGQMAETTTDGAGGNRAQLITAQMFGGQATGQGWIRLGPETQFALRATLADADLAQIAREHLPGSQDLRGKLYGWVYLQGYGTNIHTFTGRGALHLRQADIYELPVMIALLKVLNLRRPDTNAFSECDLEYRIAGPHIYLDRIVFQGDAISLHGAGETNFHGELNLALSPMLGREDRKSQVLKRLLGGAGQEFMVIRVTGSLHDPKTEKQVFPTLNQAVQNLANPSGAFGPGAGPARETNPLGRFTPNPLRRPWPSLGPPPPPMEMPSSAPSN